MSNFKVNITGIDTNKLKVLKSDETIELLKRLRAGENVKDEIVMGNLKLVLSAVKPYRSQKYSLDDLFQIGVIGLIKSIDNFDVSKNVMFSTYAVPMIRGEIKRYVRDSVSILRVSRQVKDLAYHCFKAKEELTQQLERSPTYEEISKYLNIKKEQVKEAFESFNPVMSFSEPINNTDEDSLELYDIISDPEDLEEKVITNLTLKTALNSLDEIERRIIDNRYFEGLTQMEVAQEFNISQAQVSRLEKQALKNMRKFFKPYNGRRYDWLSLSEKIRAGMEVSELMKRLTGRNYPQFVDNMESVDDLANVRPTGQVIMAKCVSKAELSVRPVKPILTAMPTAA